MNTKKKEKNNSHFIVSEALQMKKILNKGKMRRAQVLRDSSLQRIF